MRRSQTFTYEEPLTEAKILAALESMGVDGKTKVLRKISLDSYGMAELLDSIWGRKYEIRKERDVSSTGEVVSTTTLTYGKSTARIKQDADLPDHTGMVEVELR